MRLGSEALAALRSANILFIALVPHGRLSELWSRDCLNRFSERGAEPGSHAVWVEGFVCLKFLRSLQSQLFRSRRYSVLLLFFFFFNADTLMSCLVCITDIKKFLLCLAYCE